MKWFDAVPLAQTALCSSERVLQCCSTEIWAVMPQL